MATSANGWPVYTSPPDGRIQWITGRIRPQDVLTIFDYLGRRFHAEVEPIRVDWSWGWAYRPIRGSSSGYSNHASATAVDLNAPRHPLGRRGTFTSSQVAAIRRILGALGGTVRWGGDYRSRADEMHFEINSSAAAVAAVAARIRAGGTPAPPEEDDMPLSDADKKWIRDAVRDGAREVVREEVPPAMERAKFDVGRNAKWSLASIFTTLLPNPKEKR